MNEQKSLKDVSMALEVASEAIAEIERRALKNPPELTFQQKIISAARAVNNGDPVKDFLTCEEMERAIETLADVYNATGVKMTVDWY